MSRAVMYILAGWVLATTASAQHRRSEDRVILRDSEAVRGRVVASDVATIYVRLKNGTAERIPRHTVARVEFGELSPPAPRQHSPSAAVREAGEASTEVDRVFASGRNASKRSMVNQLIAIGPLGRARIRELARGDGSDVPVLLLCRSLLADNDTSEIDFVAGLIDGPNRATGIAAARALAECTSPRVDRHLVSALEHTNAAIRTCAFSALSKRYSHGTTNRSLLELRVAEAMYSTALPSVHARLLASFGSDTAFRAVGNLMKSANDDAMIAALQALPRWKDKESGAIVRPLLDHSSKRVRKEAALAAGRARDTLAVFELIERLDEEEDRGVAANVHWALKRITGQRLAPDPELWRRWWHGRGEKLMLGGRS